MRPLLSSVVENKQANKEERKQTKEKKEDFWDRPRACSHKKWLLSDNQEKITLHPRDITHLPKN